MPRFGRNDKGLTTVLAAALLLCSMLAARAAPPALELVVLGSGGPRADGRAASGNLIVLDGHPRLLVDAGSGIFTRIGELHVDLADLDTILLTHLHIDHAADVPSVLKARAMVARGPISFTIFGPGARPPYPATTRFVDLLFGPEGAFAYQKSFGAPETIAAIDLPIALTAPRQKLIDTDGLTVSAIPTRHGDAPSSAYRIDYRGRSIVFSGDIDPAGLPNLTSLAQGADLLVFNCAVIDPPGSPADLYKRHTPPKRIGRVAADARVKAVLLSHIAPLVEQHLDAVVKSVHVAYGGTVTVATDTLHVDLP